MRMMAIVISMLVILPWVVPAEEPPDVLEMALLEADIQRRDLRGDPLSLLASRGSAGQLPFLRGTFADPVQSGYRLSMFAERYQRRLDSPHRLMMSTTALTGADIARGYIGNPLRPVDVRLLAAQDPLAAALEQLAEASEPFDPKPGLPSLEEFPNPVRHEVARLVGAIAQAEKFRQRAFEKLPEGVTPELLMRQVFGHEPRPMDEPDYREFISQVEMEALAAGILDLVAAVEDFDNFIATADLPEMAWRLQTPLGEIVYTSEQKDDVHELRTPLLLIDLAGDEEYQTKDRTPASGICIIYDGAGNDSHGGSLGVGAASAILGYSILWDRQGNDHYEGGVLTQGAALFAAALLYDGAGDDSFFAIDAAQSFALCGTALLVNMGGNDQYVALARSQGSAGPRGGAVLLDVTGDDVYTMSPEPVVSRSAQLPDRNNSMGQGCGWGVRADLGDGRSLAGGAAMLMDLKGNDSYTGTVFCQGAGFYEGVGALFDGAGNDSYAGDWYTQAAGAHRAVGLLVDRGDGNDLHSATHYTSICAAHDASVTFLQNEEGDDVYAVKDLGLGAATDNGIAIFVEGGGDDRYSLASGSGHGLGSARITHYGTVRENALSAGLFFDLGGDDRYEVRRVGPSNHGQWGSAAVHPALKLPAEAAAGIDGEYNATSFPLGPLSPAGDADDKVLQDALKERRAYRARIQ